MPVRLGIQLERICSQPSSLSSPDQDQRKTRLTKDKRAIRLETWSSSDGYWSAHRAHPAQAAT